MPYKSQAQAAYFNIHRKELEAQGVNVGEWNSATKGKHLPKHARHGGAVAAAMRLVKRRYAEGGGTPQNSYDTPLTPSDENAFQDWKAQYAPHDSGYDYDLRGAFKSGFVPDPQTGHWDDKFKKPNHPTFSVYSNYAKFAPQMAGQWEGNLYVPPPNAHYAEGGDVEGENYDPNDEAQAWTPRAPEKAPAPPAGELALYADMERELRRQHDWRQSISVAQAASQ